MNYLIVESNYDEFWRSVYADAPELARAPHAEQLAALHARCFGTADFYSHHLRSMGHQASDAIWNCRPLQTAWAREHAPGLHAARPGNGAPWPEMRAWLHALACEQVRQARPDALFIKTIYDFAPETLREMKRHTRMLFGQCAYRGKPGFDLSPYDLLVSSMPRFVDGFRAQGVAAEHLPLGFDPRVLDAVGRPEQDIDAAFIGNFTLVHETRTRFLERVHRAAPFDIWGVIVDGVAADSPLRASHHGEVWGLDMFRTLARCRVSLNAHYFPEDAADNCNNMRLYEATGVGSCLLTDRKSDLADYFEEGTEVVVYDTAEDCAEKLAWLLEHEDERAAIARAGQRRTLGEHTYGQRTERLHELVGRMLRRPAAAKTAAKATDRGAA